MRDKLIKKEEFVKMLRDCMTIMTGGYASCGIPDALLEAVEEAGVKNLTIISNDCAYARRGVSRLLENGQISKMVTTHIGRNPLAGELYGKGQLALELVPQGTLTERIRADGAGLGGVLTPVGVGTEVEEGKEKLTVKGKEYLLELPLHADLALIRAAQADTFGNLVYEGTTINFNPLMAMAADLVVADVGSICEIGSFAPEQVGTPGIFVDYVLQGYPMDHVWER